jgi:integrase
MAGRGCLRLLWRIEEQTMARGIHKLTAADLRRREPGMYGDGGGLWLQVTAGIWRSWIFRFTVDGRRREMGLGPLADVSLSEARSEALRCRKLVREGIDPIEQRKADRAARAGAAARTITFDECVGAYLAAHRDEWRSEKHAKFWDQPLRRDISPVLGKLPVAQIDIAVLMKALLPMWERIPTTASRVRERIENILDWATVSGYRSGENPARWRGHLEHLLPSARKVAPVVHHPAMPYKAVPAFMAKLRAVDSTPARVLEFLILTATRSGEPRGATWGEIDLEDATWVVPGVRMKAGREHRVPLSRRALEIVKQQKAGRSAPRGLLFVGRGGVKVADTAVRYVLKSIGHGDVTPHGFRSSFRDWAGEQTNFPREVAEAALAHSVGNEVERAYRRGDALEKRRRLMNAWADFCEKPAPLGATVTPLRKANIHA